MTQEYWDAKVDAYNMAISYLQSEECAYDNDAPYRVARQRLSQTLERQLTMWIRKHPCPRSEKEAGS